jgi:S-adenosylmethionine hydrolase
MALGGLVALTACARGATQREPATILFLTDFGTRDGAVAACKGVMWSIAPRANIVDVSHEVPPYDVETAGELLEQALPFYPAGVIVVAVVDPGVGSERRATAMLTKKGHILVGPDNGIFTLVMQTEGLERAVELRNSRYFRSEQPSFTFHGRDLFAPVAAHLAAGVPLDSLGPPIDPVRLDVRPPRIADGRIEGIVRYIEDPYGNVVTNVPVQLLDSIHARIGDSLEVRIGSRLLRLPWRATFSDVPTGRALALVHSRGLLSFSVNQGDFASTFRVRRKDAVTIRRISR